jgi:proline iminopeptidase
MTDLYPEIEPYEHGFLEVGDGNSIYWEICGNPDGKPVVVLHGGPGSGCTPWYRRLFDPGAYRIVLFDQRNCGRSTPHASALDTDLHHNTTAHLIADIELLRQYLKIDRWMVFGGSWGSTLSLAYAVNYPEYVTDMILFGVTTGRHSEIDWLFRGGVSIFFPEQWDRLRMALPETERNGDILAAYNQLLNGPDWIKRQQAANSWCLWESATLSWPPTTQLRPRFRDPVYALAFARIVTRYTHHNSFLEDGILMSSAHKLANIPGIMVNGRFDFQAPIGNAWALKQVWPHAELVIVDNAGHSADSANLTREFIRATDRFATLR